MLMLVGCASHASLPSVQSAPPAAQTIVSVSGPATAPADTKSRLTLAQIEPRVSFATTVPTTGPSEPPVEAVRLYAQARIATLEGRRYAAAQLLEKAIALDPGSFELHNSLADVYAAGSDPRALREWESAAEIEPDRLDTQIQLGRQYVIQGDFDAALQHLWMALGTAEYKRDHASSGEAAGVRPRFPPIV
jgi:thioredoxin-like negative regulator of GroEL